MILKAWNVTYGLVLYDDKNNFDNCYFVRMKNKRNAIETLTATTRDDDDERNNALIA